MFIYALGLDDVKIYHKVVIFVSDNFKNNYLLLPQFFCFFFLVF